MRLRWSDGRTFAHEFNSEVMSLQDALFEFRRHRPRGRAELHVQVDANRWTDPAFAHAGYVHTIHVPGMSPDMDPQNIPVRGTDRVFIIGPGGWHDEAILVACQRAVAYYQEVTRFLPTVVALAATYKPELEKDSQKGEPAW